MRYAILTASGGIEAVGSLDVLSYNLASTLVLACRLAGVILVSQGE